MADLAKKNKIKKKQKNQKRYSLPNKIKKQVVREVDDLNMSQLLVDFAQPLFEENGGKENIDEETFHMIIDIAKLAWNCSLLPISVREKLLGDIIENTSASETKLLASMQYYFDLLIERKNKKFSPVKRVIDKTEIIAGQDGFALNVFSSPLSSI